MEGRDSQPGSALRRVTLDLRFVPLARVYIHEDFEEGRSAVLRQAVQAQGTLRNPPIVAAVGPRQYLHLDGANRLTTLRALGYTYTLVQVVRLEEQRLGLWSHRARLDNGAVRDVVSRVAGARVLPVAEDVVATTLRSQSTVAVIARQGDEAVVISVWWKRPHASRCCGNLWPSTAARTPAASSIRKRSCRRHPKRLLTRIPAYSCPPPPSSMDSPRCQCRGLACRRA